MIIKFNKEVVNSLSMYRGRYSGRHIAVAIDSSKTNTAIAVFSNTFKPLDVIEFGGTDEKDVFVLAKKQRDELRFLFEDATISDGAIEDVITTDRDDNHMNYHHARLVLTAVYVSLIVFFQDEFNVMIQPIANTAWKRAVLGAEGLNKRNIYKGSVEHISKKYPQWVVGDKVDDVTDALCIGEYLGILRGASGELIEDLPNQEELAKYHAKYRLYPISTKLTEGKGIEFLYNPNLSLDGNARLITNRIPEDKYGYTKVDTNNITLEDIYQFAVGNSHFDERTEKMLLVVRRV